MNRTAPMQRMPIWEALHLHLLYTHESNHMQYVMCPFIVQIELLAKGGKCRNRRGVEGCGYIIHVKTLYHRNDLIYLSFSPKVWIMKAFMGAPYIAMFILNLWLTEARAGKPLWNP